MQKEGLPSSGDSNKKENKSARWISSLFFLVLGLGLLGLTVYRQDLEKVSEYLATANYTWMGVILVVALIGHWVRALRWQMLIEPLGFRPPVFRIFLALMSGYFINLGIPRLGEVTRCAALWRSEKIPFPGLLGTVVSERVIDVVFLVLFAAFSFSLQYARLENYLQLNVWEPLQAVFAEKSELLPWLLGSIAVFFLIAGIGVLLFSKKIKGWLQHKLFLSFKAGLFSLLDMGKGTGGAGRLGKFLVFTLLIWLGYFLMTWLWFFAFPQTASLGLITALFIWTIANISRTLPIHGGGLGAFHFLVTGAFVLFAVDESLGLAIATLMHGTQTLFYLVVGGISWIILMYQQGKVNKTSIHSAKKPNQAN